MGKKMNWREARRRVVGKYMIHIGGEGHDRLFDTLEEVRAAAEAEKAGVPDLPVDIVQIVEIA